MTKWYVRLDYFTALAIIGIFPFVILLTSLHFGLYPTVFADEWIYSSSARLLPLSQSVYPSYLFLFIFKTTSIWGSQFLEGARFINACCFSCALPFIFLIARQVTSPKIAFFIAVFSLLGPINSYTAYFMPESLYFFSFWFFTWFVLRNIHQSPFIFGGGVGLILSLMSLIKMHAIFLLFAMIMFLLSLSWSHARRSNSSGMTIQKALLNMIYMLISFFLLRTLFGFILAGSAGINIFGAKYTLNTQSALNFNHLLQTLQIIKIPLIGNVIALSVLFGLPLAALGTKLYKKTNVNSLQVFTISCLLSLLFITIFMTGQSLGWGPYDVLNRIHMRIYNFLFPLLFIIACCEISETQKQSFSFINWVFILLIIISIISAMLLLHGNFIFSYIDGPELFGFTYDIKLFFLLSMVSLLCVILWIFKRKWGASLYAFFFLPAAILISSYFVTTELRQQRLITDAYDRGGQFAHDYLGSQTSNLVIVGNELAGLYKTLFYIDNPKTTITKLPLDTPVEFAKIPANAHWVLIIGKYPILRHPSFQITKEGYTLIKIG